MIANGQKDRVTEQKCPTGHDGLAQSDKDNAHVLGIAHTFVEANDDQLTRWIVRRWCAVTATNEINEAPNNNRYSRHQQSEANQMCRSQIEMRPPSAGDQGEWNQA
jgi:hypothetical protein